MHLHGISQPGTVWLSFGPRIAAVVWALFAGSLATFFIVKGDDLMPPTPEWYPWFTVMNWVTGIAILFSLLAVISAMRIWWRPNTRWITRVKFTLVGISCAVLSLLAAWYHVIGPARRI